MENFCYREFLDTAWMKDDKEVVAPNILRVINNFNMVRFPNLCQTFCQLSFEEIKNTGVCTQASLTFVTGLQPAIFNYSSNSFCLMF